MNDDQRLYMWIGIGAVIYFILAWLCPMIVWILIAAGICCWFGGN